MRKLDLTLQVSASDIHIAPNCMCIARHSAQWPDKEVEVYPCSRRTHAGDVVHAPRDPNRIGFSRLRTFAERADRRRQYGTNASGAPLRSRARFPVLQLCPPATLEELSQDYGVSRQGVRRIEVRALEKIRTPMRRQLARRNTARRAPTHAQNR